MHMHITEAGKNSELVVIGKSGGGESGTNAADKIRSVLYGAGELTAAWKAVQIALYVLAAAGLVWCMLRLSTGAYNPFIYFRF